MVCLANKSEKQAGKKGNEEEEETNTTPAKKKKRKVKESMCEEKKKKKRVATPLRRGRSSKVRMCEFPLTKLVFLTVNPWSIIASANLRTYVAKAVDCMFIWLLCLATPLKKGEKNHIWNWPLYRTNLPVRCGAQKATLDRRKMAKGHRNS